MYLAQTVPPIYIYILTIKFISRRDVLGDSTKTILLCHYPPRINMHACTHVILFLAKIDSVTTDSVNPQAHRAPNACIESELNSGLPLVSPVRQQDYLEILHQC